MLEVSSTQYIIEYFDSRHSGKAKVTMNGHDIFKGEKQGSEFTIPFRLGKLPALTVIKGNTVDLLISNRYFKHELARIQESPPIREDEFEPDFPDTPEKPKYVEERKQEMKDPFEGAKPEAVRPKAEPKQMEAPKPQVQPEAVLVDAPKAQPQPQSDSLDFLSSAFAANAQVSDSSKSAADMMDELFTGPKSTDSTARSAVCQHEDDLLGSTIKPAKPVQPPPPVHPAPPSTVQQPPQPYFYPGQPYMGPYMTGQAYMMPQGGMYMPNPAGPMMYMSQPGGMYPGQLAMPISGVVPAVRAGLELSTPPNVVPGQFNNEGDLPDFFTPHKGLIGSNPMVAKSSRLNSEPVILQKGNPFVGSAQPQDTSYSADKDLHSVVDLSNLGKNMHSPPLAQRYQDQVRGVQVPGSNPAVPIKDLPKRS